MADSLTAKLFSFIDSTKRRVADQFSDESLKTTAEVLKKKLENPQVEDLLGVTGTIGSAIKVLGPEAAFQAQRLLSKGTSNKVVFDLTKAYEGPLDKQLRAVISDEGAILKNRPMGKLKITVGDMLEHPELYKVYPDIKDIRLRQFDMPEGSNASYGKTGGKESITLSTRLNPEAKLSSLLHEVQHAVQGREGFTSGSNVDAMRRSPLMAEGMSDPKTVNDLVSQKLKDKDPRTLADILAEKLYRLVGGEAEARAVQNQLQQRDWTSFPLSNQIYDVDASKVIPPR